MQYLSFIIGDNRYVLSSHDVVTVLPLVKLDHMYQVPDYVAGLLHYRKEFIPVIDVATLIEQRVSEKLITTRLVLVNCQLKNTKQAVVGLVLERALNTLSIADTQWRENPLPFNGSSFFGEIASVNDETVQRVRPSELLNDDILSVLEHCQDKANE